MIFFSFKSFQKNKPDLIFANIRQFDVRHNKQASSFYFSLLAKTKLTGKLIMDFSKKSEEVVIKNVFERFEASDAYQRGLKTIYLKSIQSKHIIKRNMVVEQFRSSKKVEKIKNLKEKDEERIDEYK